MKKVYVSLLAALTIGWPIRGFATIILSAPEVAVFNFNLTSVNPGIVAVRVFPQFGDWDVGTDVGSLSFFGDHGASGAAQANYLLFESPINSFGVGGNADLDDGIFSVRITANAGEFAVMPVATAFVTVNGETRESVRFDPLSVPEPGSLALLGLGGLGLALGRRFRRNASSATRPLDLPYTN